MPFPDPVDQRGYMLTTLHTFTTRPVGGAAFSRAYMAASPDGSLLYLTNGFGTGTSNVVFQLDTRTWEITTFVTITDILSGQGQVDHVVTDSAGNLYVPIMSALIVGGGAVYRSYIARITPTGVVTTNWVILPLSNTTVYAMTFGRDGMIYLRTERGLYSIDGSGTVNAVPLPPPPIAGWGGSLLYLAATSDGALWLPIADNGGPNYGVNNTITRLSPSRLETVEYPIQALVDIPDDRNPEIVGIWVDGHDNLLVALATLQGVTGGAPNLVWFLRFDTTTGIATRIAGSWMWPQARPGAVDGPLGTSLAESFYLGATGATVSSDGRTVWFWDDTDQDDVAGRGNLLRTLSGALRGVITFGAQVIRVGQPDKSFRPYPRGVAAGASTSGVPSQGGSSVLGASTKRVHGQPS